MKKFFALLICIFLSIPNGWSQDVITFNNGQQIEVDVREVGRLIRYKKLSNLEGPVYTIPISDVNFIEYANGEIDYVNRTPDQATLNNFGNNMLRRDQRYYYYGTQRISRTKFFELLKTEPDVYQDYVEGRSLATTGSIVGGIGLLTVGIGVISAVSSNDMPTAGLSMMLIGALIAGPGALLSTAGHAKMQRSLNVFNYSDPTGLKLHLKGAGIGLTYSF